MSDTSNEPTDEPAEQSGSESSEPKPKTSADQLTFADMGLGDQVLKQLASLGYEEPTPIQQQAIPSILVGRDLIGQAQTGTGKTAAFALPIVEMVRDAGPGDGPLALVLAPTRELAIQVSEAVHKYGSTSGVRVVPIYGGQPIGRQLDSLRRGVDVVVATPGRALDHIRRRSLRLDAIEILVLDEADEMLDMGFADEIDAIIEELPEDRQTVLFSATMPNRIMKMARSHLNDPIRILIDRSTKAEDRFATVEQRCYVVAREHKSAALGRILDVESPPAAIVFCRTRYEVDNLTESLNGRGYRAEALHGGMSQEQRDRVMSRLRSGTAELLVATDVAARGLDVDQLTHVFNYDVPADAETYVHRIGRVGRAGRTGTAITFAEPREKRQIRNIESETGVQIAQHGVPSVAELRDSRLETLRSEVLAAIASEDLSFYQAVVESMAEDADPVAIALGALHLAHSATARVQDDQEIPAFAARPERRKTSHRADGPSRGKPSRNRSDRDRGDRGERGNRSDRDRDDRGDRSRSRSGQQRMARLYVGAGREARIRPGDLVGAIANETNLNGRDIGSIDMHDRFALVEVPESAVNEVITALNRTTLKGRKVKVRRDRF
ncbi:MAG: DEAD/DEAH box helicase [Microthrixaceae bacterium]|nr:DEAD/DEAH box helicase [Microthrixaceae bacterium]